MVFFGGGGPATVAELNSQLDVDISSISEIYIAETLNNVIRLVYTNGTRLLSASNWLCRCSRFDSYNFKSK
jgi:hypothetical protein